jgi:hypothetical protein
MEVVDLHVESRQHQRCGHTHDHEEAWALGQTAQPMRFGTLGNQDMTMSRNLEITL